MITVPSTSIYTLMNKIGNGGSLMDTNATKKCRQTRKILLTQFFTAPKAIQNTVINSKYMTVTGINPRPPTPLANSIQQCYCK